MVFGLQDIARTNSGGVYAFFYLYVTLIFMRIKLIKTAGICFVTVLLTSTSCTKNPEEILPTDPVPITLNSTQASMIGSGNAFAFDIFRMILENADESENIIISPLSISYALSMTLNGANGTTRDSIFKALRLNGITPEELNSSYKDLTDALLSVDKRVAIKIANSVWTEEDFQVKKSFIDILTGYYNTESKQFDINDQSAPDKINEWIEDNTNGLIKHMVDKLNDNTVMLLINAIYFKGKWKSQFDAGDTQNRPFYKSGGTSADVPMMKQSDDFMFYDGDGFILGEFPYGQGNYVMDIILPDNYYNVNTLMPGITDISFNGWVSQMTKREVNLYLPRFKYAFKKQLKDILSQMGMGIAFTDAADFTNIAASPPLLINDVTHQAFIETNEEGTEAAAATIVDIGLTSIGPSLLVFNADHPFIFIIRESTTNSIIFMGRVSDPGVN
jgi:serine protease inhibitor